MFYSPMMLPDINYRDLVDDDFVELINLEYNTKMVLIDFLENIEDIFKGAKMSPSPRIILAHMAAFLGFITVAGLGEKRALELKDDIAALITREATESFQLFLKYPVITGGSPQEHNLYTLTKIAPCRIVEQTMRLSRVIHELFYRLDLLQKDSNYDVELLAPVIPFMALLKTKSLDILNKFKNNRKSSSVLYHINQTAVQIGWITGCFSSLDTSKNLSHNLDYACAKMKLYIDISEEYIQTPETFH